MKKIKEEQLNKIRSQQGQIDQVLNEVGYLEASKHALLHKLAGINEKVEDFKKELEKEYGSVNIDLKTGEYTEIEKEPELSKV